MDFFESGWYGMDFPISAFICNLIMEDFERGIIEFFYFTLMCGIRYVYQMTRPNMFSKY